MKHKFCVKFGLLAGSVCLLVDFCATSKVLLVVKKVNYIQDKFLLFNVGIDCQNLIVYLVYN